MQKKIYIYINNNVLLQSVTVVFTWATAAWHCGPSSWHCRRGRSSGCASTWATLSCSASRSTAPGTTTVAFSACCCRTRSSARSSCPWCWSGCPGPSTCWTWPPGCCSGQGTLVAGCHPTRTWSSCSRPPSSSSWSPPSWAYRNSTRTSITRTSPRTWCPSCS